MTKVRVAAVAPPQSHARILYPIAVLKRSRRIDDARRFAKFLRSEEASADFASTTSNLWSEYHRADRFDSTLDLAKDRPRSNAACKVYWESSWRGGACAPSRRVHICSMRFFSAARPASNRSRNALIASFRP